MTASADSYVNSNDASDNGTNTSLHVGRPSATVGTERTFMRFPAVSVPGGCTAVLTLLLRTDAAGLVAGRTVNVQGISATWIESGVGYVQWANQPGVSGPVKSFSCCAATNTNFEVDITALGQVANGYRLVDSTETNSSNNRFRAREISTATFRPRLTVAWS